MGERSARSAIRDPILRRFTARILREYRKSGSAARNENLKHVLRMVKALRGHALELQVVGADPETLEIGILVSDLGKESHIIARHAAKYQGDSFRAFLDHSRTSMIEGNRIRLEEGVSDRQWRRILYAIIGHDGPSIDGSWWKKNYEQQLGKRYPRLHSVEGMIHCYLDRMDQGGIFRGRNEQLNGGLRKISYDLFQKGTLKGKLAAVIQEIFGSTRFGTFEQLDHLDYFVWPRFLGKQARPRFLEHLRDEFDAGESFFGNVIVDFTRPDRVTVVMDDGSTVEATTLDEFWRTLSKVTPRTIMGASCRMVR